MTDLNHVVLIGRLTHDLGTDSRSFAYTPNGTARASISIAVNRSVKRGEEWSDDVSYFDVTIWGKTAENLKPYLTKGKQIAIDGYLKQDRWEKDGQKFSKVNIQADTVQLLGGKNDGGGYSDGTYKQNNQYQQGGQYQQGWQAQQGNQYQQNGSAFTPRPQSRQNYQPPSADEFPEDIPF